MNVSEGMAIPGMLVSVERPSVPQAHASSAGSVKAFQLSYGAVLSVALFAY
jgi:hypothetical protein